MELRKSFLIYFYPNHIAPWWFEFATMINRLLASMADHSVNDRPLPVKEIPCLIHRTLRILPFGTMKPKWVFRELLFICTI